MHAHGAVLVVLSTAYWIRALPLQACDELRTGRDYCDWNCTACQINCGHDPNEAPKRLLIVIAFLFFVL